MKCFCTNQPAFAPTPLSAIFHLPRSLIVAFFAVAAAFSAPGEVRADLRVCNMSVGTVSIALGYRTDEGWQSEGWWVTGPQDCKTVFLGDLPGRFYYIYAVDDVNGASWDGQVFMCTRDGSFTIIGTKNCLVRGYERTGFFEVDTENKTDWTLQLTETPPNGAPQPEQPAPEAQSQ